MKKMIAKFFLYLIINCQQINDLQWIENQTPEICLDAVQKNNRNLFRCSQKIWSSTSIYRQSNSFSRCSEENGLSLKYVKNQTPEICLDAENNKTF